MATNTLGTNARQLPHQVVHFLRRTIKVADAGLVVDIGELPAGAVILKPLSGVMVHTVFNAGTNNFLDIGPSTDTGENLWATQLTMLGLGFIPFDEVVTGRVDVDTLVQAVVGVTGNAATTGEAEIIICYIPDTDL